MKRTKLRAQSKTPISTLKRKLWKLFSEYIRKRDKFTCFTCGRKGEGSGMHAGHFISKAIGGITLYFSEDNVKSQCYNCNINLGGSQWEFGQRLGPDRVKMLYAIKNSVHAKWTEQDYLERIELYKQKIKTLEHA